MTPIFDALVREVADTARREQAALRRHEMHRRAALRVGEGFVGTAVLLAVTSNA